MPPGELGTTGASESWTEKFALVPGNLLFRGEMVNSGVRLPAFSCSPQGGMDDFLQRPLQKSASPMVLGSPLCFAGWIVWQVSLKAWLHLAVLSLQQPQTQVWVPVGGFGWAYEANKG